MARAPWLGFGHGLTPITRCLVVIFLTSILAGPALADETSNCAKIVLGPSHDGSGPEILSRQSVIYSHCVLLDSLKYPAFRTQLRALAVESDLEGAEQATHVADLHESAELLGRLVEGALDAGYADARTLSRYIDAMRTAAPGDVEIEAYALALEGRILLAAGRGAEAKAALQRAVLLESQRAVPSRLPDWYLVLADIAPNRRQEFVHTAYIALENIRPLLPLRDPITQESTFSLHVRRVFENEIDNDLAENGGAVDPAVLARTQDVVEAYRQAEIRSAFGSDCVPPLPRMEPGILRNDEVLLYPILLADRIELLVATGTDREYRRLPPNSGLNRDAIVPLIHRVRDALSSRGKQGWQDDSRALYRALIQPIEKLLGPQTTLVIVPDGPLRLLPFAALTDANGEFLIQRTRLAIAPALSYTQPGDDNSGPRAWTVAAYLNRDVKIDGQVFGALAKTSDEATDATTEGNESSANLGETIGDFDKQRLDSALGQRKVAILHLATHASFDGRSDQSFLVTSSGKLTMSELREMIAARHARGEEIELLVLSACETALGDDEASMGFAGTAVQEGARSALASLWDVNDPSTEELMKAFYASYRTGATRAEALRAAQLKVLSEYHDPYFWAAFVLIGGWR